MFIDDAKGINPNFPIASPQQRVANNGEHAVGLRSHS